MTSPTRECNLYHPIVTKSSCKTGLHARCHLPAWSHCAGILVEVVVRAARINRWQGGAKPDPRNSLPARPRVSSCWYYCWPADLRPSLKACYCQWCYADLILSREVRWSCSLNLCKAPSDDLLGSMRTYYRPWKKLSIENLYFQRAADHLQISSLTLWAPDSWPALVHGKCEWLSRSRIKRPPQLRTQATHSFLKTAEPVYTNKKPLNFTGYDQDWRLTTFMTLGVYAGRTHEIVTYKVKRWGDRHPSSAGVVTSLFSFSFSWTTASNSAFNLL